MSRYYVKSHARLQKRLVQKNYNFKSVHDLFPWGFITPSVGTIFHRSVLPFQRNENSPISNKYK